MSVFFFFASLALYCFFVSRSTARKNTVRPRQRRAGVFMKATSEAPQVLDPGSCDAQRIAEILMMQSKAEAVAVTPEWRAEQQAKREAYAQSRREWQNKLNEPED
jgi:hypothetical protein